jgi:hypothetical protein
VSNPLTGDLAHNNGAQIALTGTFSGVPGAPVEDKAAFNNFPYQYGVVERTFSEHKASELSDTLVSAYGTLPADLKAGAIQAAYEAALVAGNNGDYADGAPRYFTCQTCHMRPVTGKGCNKRPKTRYDLPLHDLTGGNYWIPEAIQYLDARGKLVLGGGLTPEQIAGMNDGKLRAAALSVTGDTVRIVNLTGHKLLSGYPEGRRMWLNIKWYDSSDALLREDGEYGGIEVFIDGVEVESILDLEGTNTKIYEAHGAITRQWANQLLGLGLPATLPVSFDRVTGEMTHTLADIADPTADPYHETFHFALNNHVAKDNRIPPYGMRYDKARVRNALPVPPAQYGSPGSGGTYDYFDVVSLNPPGGAVYAAIDLLYQPTSWEYIQFLYLANDRSVAFLADEGQNLLDAWLNTGMAVPYIMASAEWFAGGAPPPPPPPPPAAEIGVDSLATYKTEGKGKNQTLVPSVTFDAGDAVVIEATVTDGDAAPVSGATVEIAITGPEPANLTTGASDASGIAEATWNTSAPNKKGLGGTTPGTYTAQTTGVAATGYTWDGVPTSTTFTLE